MDIQGFLGCSVSAGTLSLRCTLVQFVEHSRGVPDFTSSVLVAANKGEGTDLGLKTVKAPQGHFCIHLFSKLRCGNYL